MGKKEVLLGLPGPWAGENREAADHCTSKIGGVPDWPVWPIHGLQSDTMLCAACGCALCLVAQVYAPTSVGSFNPDDRTIYVFCCSRPNCRSSSLSWRAIRVQKVVDETSSSSNSNEVCPSLSASNTGWLDDYNDDENIDLDALRNAFSEVETCYSDSKKFGINGISGTGKICLGSQMRTTNDKMPVLPCFYLYTQAEISQTDIISVSSTISIKDNQNDTEENEVWEQEAFEYDNALHADRAYLKFKKQVDAFPEQCFRYSYGGNPTLTTAIQGDPGNCKLCGCLRHFELQLMSPIIFFLQQAGDKVQENIVHNWDWITILIYTCSKACSMSKTHAIDPSNCWIAAEETVVVQYE